MTNKVDPKIIEALRAGLVEHRQDGIGNSIDGGHIRCDCGDVIRASYADLPQDADPYIWPFVYAAFADHQVEKSLERLS